MSDINNRLTPSEAQQRIREIAKLGDIIPTYHYNDTGQNVRNYSLQDVEHVLKNGLVTEAPIFDTNHRSWKYKVEGKAINGDVTIVITAFVSPRELVAITVFLK